MRAPAFWYADGTLARLLSPVGCLYHTAGVIRRRRIRPTRVPVPVICVGNLTSGGAGKTPVVLSILARLSAQGLAAQALTRGYGGALAGPVAVDISRHDAGAVGDEALLLARQAPTWVARRRDAGAEAAVAAGAEVIVMDDGFQNPQLAKDLSLVVVDGAVGLGNGRVLPAGPLRETAESGWARAQAVVILGEDATGLTGRLPKSLPVLRAHLKPEPESLARLRGRRLFAFAGIGRPEKFFDSLRGLGLDLVGQRGFGDHHTFTEAEIAALRRQAGGLDATLVTTQKDGVRLSEELAKDIQVLPVSVAWEDPAGLDGLLAPLFTARHS